MNTRLSKAEAKQRYSKAAKEFEMIADRYWECRKARSSGKMSEQEFDEKVESLKGQQEALKKELYETRHIAIFGDHLEGHQDA